MRVDAGAAARELALLHSEYGLHVSAAYEGRVERPPLPRSPQDGAVLLRNAVQADEGEYECRVSTFPAGSFQARLRLRVLGKPACRAEAGRRGGGGTGARGSGGRGRYHRSARAPTWSGLHTSRSALGRPHLLGSAPFCRRETSLLVSFTLWVHMAQAYSLSVVPSPLCSLDQPAPLLLCAQLGPSPAVPFQVLPFLPSSCSRPSHVTSIHSDCPLTALQRAEAPSHGPPSFLFSKLNLGVFRTVLPKTPVQSLPHIWSPCGAGRRCVGPGMTVGGVVSFGDYSCPLNHCAL